MDIERIWRVAEMVLGMMELRKCKYCGSVHVVRNGHNKRRQRLLCRDCGHTFMDDEAIPGMRTPHQQIASALNMYYEGMSLNGIRRHLEQMYRNCPSDSTVYDWITRFSEAAIKEAGKHKPSVGDVWVADEMVLKIEGKNTWFWDIIDTKTRFLLASHVSGTRTTRDAKRLMQKAHERAGKVPRTVVTDKLAAYVDGIEQAFGADSEHVQSKPFSLQNANNLIERFHGTLKARTKVMRGLKSRESARLLTEGWLVHYNYLRGHESLKGKTPAEKAGIAFPYKNWLDITKSPTVTYISVKPRTIRMRLSAGKSARMRLRPPRMQTRRRRRGDRYEGQGLISRHAFLGGKPKSGRLI